MKRETIKSALYRLAPHVPSYECNAIIDHALDSKGLRKASPETAAWLSMVAYIRHALTDYDELLADGYDDQAARHYVLPNINAILSSWGSRRQIQSDILLE